jgi:flavodoxin
MKALVVYEAMWGNTREIVEAVASGLRQYAEVTIIEAAQAPRTLPDDVDLVVAGGPTNAYDGQLRRWLDGLPTVAVAPAFALFETRLGIARPLPHSAGRRSAKAVTERGYRIITELHTFYVHGHRGPLESSERNRAALWGERVVLEAQLATESV